MDSALFDYLHQELSPVFNKTITQGIAVREVPYAMAYIDSCIRCGEPQYPPGFEYVGSERCTPLEEYNVITRERAGNTRVYDIAKSDVYMVKYKFRNHGRDLAPIYMYLPFVGQAGMLHISGKQFAIAPVMGDVAFEIEENSVFIRIPRAPMSFNRESYTVVVDGKRVRDQVVYSQLHYKKPRQRSQLIRYGHVFTSLPHYLFARYGLFEAFEKFTGTRPVLMRESEYNAEDYPPEHWIKIKSMRVPPKGINKRRERNYGGIATQLVLLVDRGAWSPLARAFVTGFFYVVDHFPDYVIEPEDLEDTWWWKVFMAYILWGEADSHGKLVSEIEDHLTSLDSYIDHEAIKTLEEVNVDCENIFDLMVYIMKEMQAMLESRRGREANLYGKRLEVLRYLLRDINNAVFGMLFKITSNSGKELTDREYDNILKKYLRPWIIHGIGSAVEHPEVSSVSNPSDNVFFKITSVIVQQGDTHGRGKSQDTKPIGPTMFLDASFSSVTGFGTLPKSRPIGNNHFNPVAKLDENLTTQEPLEHKPLLDSVQALIRRC